MTTKKRVIATGTKEVHTVALRHPLNGCEAVATQAGYYQKNGRAVGLVLEFADGHRASLSYAEIRQLQQGEETDGGGSLLQTKS